jgi:hypothetical protein
LLSSRPGASGDRVVVPRRPLLEPPSLKAEVEAWSKDKSVFKTFIEETDSLMDSCFDFDWRCSKLEPFLNKLVKKEGA